MTSYDDLFLVYKHPYMPDRVLVVDDKIARSSPHLEATDFLTGKYSILLPPPPSSKSLHD